MEPKLLRQIHLPPTFIADRKLKRFLLLRKNWQLSRNGLSEGCHASLAFIISAV